MSLSSTLASSAMGSVKKAYLLIHKNKDGQDVQTQDVIQKADAALAASTLTAGKVTAAVKSAGERFAQSGGHVMQVQYNPASLSLHANADPVAFSSLQQNIDSGIPSQNVRPPSITLSVELVFDAMNAKDAFMAEKFSLSAGGIVSSVAGAKKLASGGYTVQPQTNALLALLLRPSTRLVTFRWGDMAFTGQVTEVQADYTMFSVSGKPIRSTVRLNISQQVESSGDSRYWDTAFDKWFQKSDSKSASLGNVLNLGGF